jgi:hypothetical protein
MQNGHPSPTMKKTHKKLIQMASNQGKKTIYEHRLKPQQVVHEFSPEYKSL